MTDQTLLFLMRGVIKNRRVRSCAQKEMRRFIRFLEEAYMIAQVHIN